MSGWGWGRSGPLARPVIPEGVPDAGRQVKAKGGLDPPTNARQRKHLPGQTREPNLSPRRGRSAELICNASLIRTRLLPGARLDPVAPALHLGHARARVPGHRRRPQRPTTHSDRPRDRPRASPTAADRARDPTAVHRPDREPRSATRSSSALVSLAHPASDPGTGRPLPPPPRHSTDTTDHELRLP